jgi:uncharacterized phage protein (TIGR01671 family)
VREIKFRAWDGRTMFNVDVLAISPCGWDCSDYGKRGVSLAYQPHIKVMQYTGLEDRNGKEIYEGDIVRDKNGYKYQVFWHPHLLKWWLMDANMRPVVKVDWGNIETTGKTSLSMRRLC